MLFVSFQDRGHDKENARAFAEGLRALGVDVWCSAIPGTIPKGQTSNAAVVRALERSTCFVLVTSGSIDSNWVLGEIDTALERADEDATYSIVPVLLPGARSRDLPVALRTLERLTTSVEPRRANAEAFREWARSLGFPVVEPPRDAPANARTQPAHATPPAGATREPVVDAPLEAHERTAATRDSDNQRRMEPEPFFVRPGALLSLLAVTLVLTGGYYMFRRFDVVGPLERPKLGTDGSGVAAAASPRTWPAVRERLTLDPRFVGVELPDQVGLLPLGQNGRTRLEEFAVEGTGAVPSEATRDAEGVLPITDEDAIVLVLVPPGSFQMGSPPGVRNGDGRPQHLVTFSQPFFIARTELTNAQLRAVPVGRNSSDARLPAAGVSWHDFVGRGSTFGLRLPTESEWEYACRAGTTTEYSFGNDAAGLATHGWYFINSGTQPLDEQTEWKFGNLDEWGCRAHPVGDATKLANPWGLHDMHGNVWEWCADSWHWNYEGAPNDGSQRLDQESPDRVVRGGAFDTPAGHLRSASRRRSNAAEPSRSVGARYARSVATN